MTIGWETDAVDLMPRAYRRYFLYKRLITLLNIFPEILLELLTLYFSTDAFSNRDGWM